MSVNPFLSLLLERKKKKMSLLGCWCVLVFASLPLGLSSQNVQFEVRALKIDAANVFLENGSPNLPIKQKFTAAHSWVIFPLFFFQKLDYESIGGFM